MRKTLTLVGALAATVLPASIASAGGETPPPPPTCETVSASPTTLWPPNHKLRLITLTGETGILVTSVFQDEVLNGRGDGNTAVDAAAGPTANTVYVRAERSGRGDGRVYVISYTTTEGCTGTVTVGVPHDQGRRSAAVDSGLRVNSFGR